MAQISAGDKVTLGNGKPIKLGKQLAKGGEAFIILVDDMPDKVARIYKKNMLDHKKENKIKEMVKISFSISDVTWPQEEELIYDGNRQLVGYLMNKIDGVEVGEFLSNLQAKEKQDIATGTSKQIAVLRSLQRMVAFCEKIATKMESLHDKKIIFADINPCNIMIDEKNYAPYFIDTDSYQFDNFITEVSTGGYLAPEIDSDYLLTQPRTLEHEYFALAVLFFILINQGCHPFSLGIAPKNLQDKANDTESKVKLLNFVLEADQTDPKYYDNKVYEKPAKKPLIIWGLMPESLRKLFVRAFAKPAQARPTAPEWTKALGEFQVSITKTIEDAEDKLRNANNQQAVAPVNNPQAVTTGSPQTATPSAQNIHHATNTAVTIKKSNVLMYAVYALIFIAAMIILFWGKIFTTSTTSTAPVSPVAPAASTVDTPNEASVAPDPVVSKPSTQSKPKKPKRVKSNTTNNTNQSTNQGSSNSQIGDM